MWPLQPPGWSLHSVSAGGCRCPERQKIHELLGGKALASIYSWTSIPWEGGSSFINSCHSGCLITLSGEGDTSRVVPAPAEGTDKGSSQVGCGLQKNICTGGHRVLSALWREG